MSESDTGGDESGQGGYRNKLESKATGEGESDSGPEGDVPDGGLGLGELNRESEPEELDEELNKKV